MNNTDTVSVLFVCTGNICRSPTAEAIFRKRIKEINPNIAFHHDSAGTHGYHVGDPPDHRSIAIAEGRGVSMKDLFARKLDQTDFERFDYIIAMDKGHEMSINALRPSNSKSVVKLLLDANKADVPDPYYGHLRDFEHTYNLIEEGVESLIEAILK